MSNLECIVCNHQGYLVFVATVTSSKLIFQTTFNIILKISNTTEEFLEDLSIIKLCQTNYITSPYYVSYIPITTTTLILSHTSTRIISVAALQEYSRSMILISCASDIKKFLFCFHTVCFSRKIDFYSLKAELKNAGFTVPCHSHG